MLQEACLNYMQRTTPISQLALVCIDLICGRSPSQTVTIT